MLRIGHGADQTAHRLLVPAARQRAEVLRELEEQSLRLRRLEAAGIISGYQAVIELRRTTSTVTVFAEIFLEKQANRRRFEKRLTSVDAVVECWEVSGTVDYVARFICPDLAVYEELSSALIDDAQLGVARIVSHVALRPICRFKGYPESLLRPNTN